MLLCSLGSLVDTSSRLTPSAVLGVLMVMVIMLGLLAGAVVLTVVGWRRHQAQLPDFRGRLQQWQSQFYCTRCDQTFVPDTRRAVA